MIIKFDQSQFYDDNRRNEYFEFEFLIGQHKKDMNFLKKFTRFQLHLI